MSPESCRSDPRHTGRNPGTMMEGHLSVATIAALSKILRICRNLRHVIGREPTAEEIGARLRLPPETIRKLLGAPPQLARSAKHPVLDAARPALARSHSHWMR